jgi:hypothetical protein
VINTGQYNPDSSGPSPEKENKLSVWNVEFIFLWLAEPYDSEPLTQEAYVRNSGEAAKSDEHPYIESPAMNFGQPGSAYLINLIN